MKSTQHKDFNWLNTKLTLPKRSILTFVTLLKMVDGKPGSWIECKVSDIAKASGIGNPYDEGILGPIRQDIVRLLNVEIRININPDNPAKEKGYRGCFYLIQGILDTDDMVSLTISSHLAKIEKLISK